MRLQCNRNRTSGPDIEKTGDAPEMTSPELRKSVQPPPKLPSQQLVFALETWNRVV
ncbi:10055_t:CDS:2 [Acaulospora colombiana]|uniref:10055_t:CDS:1 n=1 Tax=Acaulospora colombiana TaxID=27376 RepID=A0ACA9NRN5_9GLOM|nr:10055_t:CDS:2 [Acaulospora colombiana]